MNENEITKNDILVQAPSKEHRKKQKNANHSKSRFCEDCRHYDKNSEREFRRKVGKKDEKGKRSEIVETRAICMNPKAASYHHLVMAANSKRQCEVWEKETGSLAKMSKKE